MDTWVGLSILIPCVGWMLVALFVLALVALLKNRPRPPQPVALRRVPSSSHPILRGLGLFVLLLLALIGLWMVGFVIYLAADRPGGAPNDAMPVGLVGLVLAVGCGGGFLVLAGRRKSPTQRAEEAGPGYRAVVWAWGLTPVVLLLGGGGWLILAEGLRIHDRVAFPVLWGAVIATILGLIGVTLGRVVWMNRKRWADALSYAHPPAPRPQPTPPSNAPPAVVARPVVNTAKPANPVFVGLASAALVGVILGLGWFGTTALTYGVKTDDLSPTGWFVGGVCAALALLASIGLFLLLRSTLVPRPPLAASPVPLSQPAPVASPHPVRQCPKCGTTIAPDAPGGLCPRCLIQQAFPSPNLSPTTAYGGFTPPTVEEVAEFFPQLEIHGLIGQGGMGAVYLATQKALDRPVALKIIRVREDDPTFEERFVREAKAMARLSHPNIVAIYDHGTAGGLPYLVLEYVDGVTLRDAMRAKRLTPAEALKIIPQVCDALEYAHSQGVVHRDVKPENILLDRSGKVKIADFGLAKVADPNGISLTHTRQAMGTPHYMAPEQWEKPSEVDHRADIYALGVVLYELLTGELPLGRFDPPSMKAAVDARIDELILRALAKEPDRRFQHATDVKLALAAIAASRFQSVYGHEYKSKWTLLGLPLVHIVRGRDPHTGRRKAAVGWLAIGDGSAIGGIAIGGTTAMGGVAIAGVASVGGIAIGGAGAMGVLALGGGWAIGGLFAAGGALATSAGLAIAGALALGKFAIAGAVADGSHRLSGSHQDAGFGQSLREWAETIWTDFVWPF